MIIEVPCNPRHSTILWYALIAKFRIFWEGKEDKGGGVHFMPMSAVKLSLPGLVMFHCWDGPGHTGIYWQRCSLKEAKADVAGTEDPALLLGGEGNNRRSYL